MHIPATLVTEKFFVAENETQAYSSWDSLQEAMSDFNDLKNSHPEKSFSGIVKVCEKGASFVFVPASLTLI